jgi:hypothetical protein
MGRMLRIRVATLLATVVLLSSAMTMPGAVLCIGPGNHCHFENPLGESCGWQFPVRNDSMPEPSDGCPKGSRDVTLRVPARPSENALAAPLFTPALTVIEGAVQLLTLPSREYLFTQGVGAALQRSTTILRF